ncbi:transposase [Aggregatibacter actinomycetemcomitans]|nr:transposase [Aggregatibacter actinomycetemcomitans]
MILNREGITLVGDVYIEGELVMEEEEEEVEGVDVFSTQINRPDLPHMKVKFLQSPHSKKPMIGMPYRHLVENAFALLKQYRAIATRYDKLARNYASSLAFTCCIRWVRLIFG